ncbi:unnamed protein product [Cyclocybe aegerita]|uniref:Uncharacterized protein n=1 Tax=Cyclocybe aegerita TaxID=1973307 RepID=A0A8S0VRB1_CYCAE|nr:unnamed protein product [Cyclocybe aegerita]
MDVAPPSYDTRSVTEDIESIIELSVKLQNNFYELRRLVAEVDEIRDMSLQKAAMDCDEKYQSYLGSSRNVSTRLNTLVQRFATHMISIAQSPHIEPEQKIQSVKLTAEKIAQFSEDNSPILTENSLEVGSSLDSLLGLLSQINRFLVLEREIIPEMRAECTIIDQEWTHVEQQSVSDDPLPLESGYRYFFPHFFSAEAVACIPDDAPVHPLFSDPEEERFMNTKLGPRFPQYQTRRPNPRYDKVKKPLIPLYSELNSQHLGRCKLCGDKVVALQQRLFPPMDNAEGKVKEVKAHYDNVLQIVTAFEGILTKLAEDAQALIQYLEDPTGSFQEQDLLGRIESEAPIYERIHQALDYYALKV